MTILYRRTWRLTLFDENDNELISFQENLETINPIRIAFWVRQLIYIVNYMARFTLYNLSQDTRFLLQSARSLVFEAGYNDVMKTLHKGLIVNVFDLRRQPDYEFIIVTQDLFQGINPIYEIIDANKTDRQAIKQALQSIPDLVIQDGNLRGLSDEPTEEEISIDNLSYIQALGKLSELLGVNIWITNNVLYTSSRNPPAITPSGSIIVILNYLNGMIGSPQIDVANSGINVKSLLNADLTAGNFVRVETLAPQIQFGGVNYIGFSQAQATRGEWEIFAVDHYGDSRGEEWYSNVSAFGAALLFPDETKP